MSRILFTALVLTALVTAAVPAVAAEVRDFSRADFTRALAEGRPVLVEVRAWWCPVCASQRRTVQKAIATSQYDRLVVFELSYDRQEEEWKSFNVRRQGTLIAFRGGQEVGRLEFETDRAMINALLMQTLN